MRRVIVGRFGGLYAVRPRHLLATLALAPAAAGAGGCMIFASAAKNIAHDAALFASDVHLCKRLRATAEAAWAVEQPTDPVRGESKDYHAGFVDGFVEFLENGGPPGSPPVPRLHYSRNRNLTPDGHAQAELYLEGYAHGVAQAEASGERAVLVVPAGAAGPPREPPPAVVVSPAPVLAPRAVSPPAPALPPTPTGAELPAPRREPEPKPAPPVPMLRFPGPPRFPMDPATGAAVTPVEHAAPGR